MGGAYRVMPAPKKYLTEEERKQANKEARLRWEAKNPDKIKAKRKRENARVKATRAARAARRAVKVKPTTRVCLACGTEKDLEEYGKHGKYGRVKICLTCNAPEPKVPAARKVLRAVEKPVKVKAPDYDALEIKLNGPKHKEKSKQRHADWPIIIGDIYGGGMVVRHKDGILLFVRPDGTFRFGVLGDDSGAWFMNIGPALRLRDKVWEKAV